MRPPLTPPPLITIGLASIGLALLLAAGCGAPPDLSPRGAPRPLPSGEVSKKPAPTLAYPPGFTPRPTPSATPSPSPSPTPFPSSTTTPCGSRPTAIQVMALLRQRTGINASRAVTGPLCSGDWHYTVVEVPDREPVQVITMGSLTLMEAGTEVCTPEIRVRAPAGIKAAVC